MVCLFFLKYCTNIMKQHIMRNTIGVVEKNNHLCILTLKMKYHYGKQKNVKERYRLSR